MQTDRILRTLIAFTLLSLCLGAASSMSTTVSEAGWIIGTAISTLGGLVHGLRARSRKDAAVGGAVVGGLSIAIGCLLAFVLGALPLSGVVAATIVGLGSGAVAAIAGRCAVAGTRPRRGGTKSITWAPSDRRWT